MSQIPEFTTETVKTGLYFGEGPRWHDGKWYYSDFYSNTVNWIDPQGDSGIVTTVKNQPSGLGWLPSGEMVIVSMIDMKVLRLEPDGSLAQHADLSDIATFWSNDMCVDDQGNCYVGDFGFDLDDLLREQGQAALVTPPGPPKTNLALVRPDGTAMVAARDMAFPNGAVITSDSTLVVAETMAGKLTAFDRAPDGSLSNRRVWADLSDQWIFPDGIAIDENDHIWVANAIGDSATRVAEGGAVTGIVHTSQHCYAVALGGPNGDQLLCVTNHTSDRYVVSKQATGKLEVATVDVAAR